MELGITTQTFLRCIREGECSEAEVFRFAAASGFSWVELRDKGFHLSDGGLFDLRNLGAKLGLRVHYAWDCEEGASPTQAMYYRVFSRAAIFGPGTHTRIILPPQELDIGFLIREADGRGVVPVFENAFESCAGFAALFGRHPAMAMTFDPANFICAKEDPEAVRRFYGEYGGRIPYVHVKCASKAALASDFIEPSDTDWETFPFDGGRWFCIELPAESGLDRTKARTLHAKDRILSMAGKRGPQETGRGAE